jgi:hypothetical protein
MQKKLMICAAGFLSLTLLAGCNKPSEESSSEESVSTSSVDPNQCQEADADLTTSPVCTKLDVTKIPYTFVEGQTYNIEDYVTIEPADTKWNIVSKSNNITVCGHKVTCVGVGDYGFQIIAGSSSKKKLPEGKIISAEVQGIRDFISSAEYNFSTELVKFGASAADDEKLLSVVHDDKYFFYTYLGTDGTEKTDGLIVLNDNNIYEASIVNGAVVPQPGIKNSVSDWHYYYGAMAMPLLSAQIVDEISASGDATGNVVVLPTAFNDYNENNMIDIEYCFTLMDTFDGSDNGTNAITSDNNVYNTSKLVLELREENGVQVLTLRTYKKDGSATGYGMKLYGIGTSGIQAAKDYAANGAIPAPAYITEASDKFKAVKSAKNYAITAKGEWREKTGDALSDAERKAFATAGSDGKSIFDYYPEHNTAASVTSDLYVGENKAVVDSADATKFQKTVIQKKQSDATDTSYYKLVEDTTTADSKTTIADTYTATKITDFTDLWLSNDYSAAVLTDAILDAARYGTKTVNEATATTAAYTSFKINNETDSGAFAFALDRLFPLARPLYNNNLDKDGAFQSDSYKYIFTTVDVYADKIAIEQYEGVNFGDSTTPVVFRYYETMTISSIGSATATAIADANVTYPAA